MLSATHNVSATQRPAKRQNVAPPQTWETLTYANDAPLADDYAPLAVEPTTVRLDLVEGVEGTVTLVAPAASPPAGVDFVFAADVSGSMTGSKLSTVISVLEWAAEQGLGDADRASLVAFQSSATLLLPLTRMDAAGRAAFTKAAKALVAGGGTAIAEALGLVAGVLRDRRQRNDSAYVLLLSDGQDDAVRYGSTKALDAIKTFATVRSIGIGEDHDPALLAALAKSAHGEFAYAANAEAIASTMGAAVGAAKSCVATAITSVTVADADTHATLRLVRNMGTLGVGETRVYHFTAPACTRAISAALVYTKPGAGDPCTAVVTATPLVDAPLETRVAIASHDCRETVASAITNATELALAGSLEAAKAALEAAVTFVSASIAKETPMCLALLEDLAKASITCASARAMRHGGLAQLMSSSGRHTTMRATGDDGSQMYATHSIAEAASLAVQASLAQ